MSSDLAHKPTVLVPLRDRASFLEHFIAADGHGGLIVPTHVHCEPGEQVDLELNFLAEQCTFRFRGRVTERLGGQDGGPGTLAVAFSTAERGVLDMVMAFANGKEVRFTEREHTRFPVALQITYSSDSAFITDVKDVTDDLSQSGAFIVTDRVLPLGTRMALRVRAPGALFPLRLQGVVCWTREAQPRGVGVKFEFASPRQKRRLQDLVAQLKSAIIADVQARMNRGRGGEQR